MDKETMSIRWLYIESVMDTPSGMKKCFDICQQIDSSTMQYVCEVLDEEDARRIVAAVNACQGIETISLEAGGLGWLQQATLSAYAQRDSLQTRLDAVSGALREMLAAFEGRFAFNEQALFEQAACDKARAALASIGEGKI